MGLLARWFRHEIELWEDVRLLFADRRRRKDTRPPIETYTHETLGSFDPDPQFPDMVVQQRDWFGSEVTISLSPAYDGRVDVHDRPEALDACAETMQSVQGDWTHLDRCIREAIADEYFELWVGEWRNENEARLSRDEFMLRFPLDSIEFAPSGDFNLICGDDGLFAGHAMSVSYFADKDALHVALCG